IFVFFMSVIMMIMHIFMFIKSMTLMFLFLLFCMVMMVMFTVHTVIVFILSISVVIHYRSSFSVDILENFLNIFCVLHPSINIVSYYTPIRYLRRDRKSTRLNSSHVSISYAVFCLKKKNTHLLSFRFASRLLILLSLSPCPLFFSLFPYTTLFRSL